ncbi:MAG TPA: DNA primase [Ignavibacteria bacterium]|nr:DNA primase [Ignavibacteria bacterium]
MLIPNEKISEIAQANDIIDVISGYIQVKKRGKSYLALCPFHQDKNPSLHISQQKQVYHCFSCKAGGNVFSFIENYEHVTFIDAVKKLADRAGIPLVYDSNSPDISSEKSRLYEINKTAAIYFRNNIRGLKSNEKKFVTGYLNSRGLDKKTLEKFGIGYSYKSWDGLLHHFKEEGVFTSEEVEKSGLIIKKEDSKDSYYDRFRGRLMFPIFNEYDKIVGFGGRKLYEDDMGGKYINSPESKVYSKSRILYGLNFAKEKIRFYDYVILVEGYMDLIALYKNEIENVVASSGTALTEEQTRLLSRYTKNVYLLFDSDTAGVKAAKRGIELLLESGFDISIISLPFGEDPDSFIKNNGKKEFDKRIQQKMSFIKFIAEYYRKENKLESVEEKTIFIKEMIGYISKIPDRIKRSLFIKEISSEYKLNESLLTDELNKILRSGKNNSFPKSSLNLPERKKDESSKTEYRKDSYETELLELFIHGDEEALAYLENNLHTEYIKDRMILSITEKILDELINRGSLDISSVINELKEDGEKEILTRISNSVYESGYLEKSGSDNLLSQSASPVYSVKNAVDLVKRFRIRELEIKRNELRSDPGKLLEVYEITKEINELVKN